MENKLLLNHYFIATIDGEACTRLVDFLQLVGEAFQFPDYYGNNLNAFNECINDLSWLDEENYALMIKNFRFFLGDELPDVKADIMNKLNQVSEEWKNVPNFDGEDEFRHKADFKIIIEE